jgi:3-hydroxyisobutyrate dehydrogenase-like beta-hydroxyacid dehydrogenase
MTSRPTVGFIGLGQIGSLIARHLVGWPGGLVVCDLRDEATAPFVERGAARAPSPTDVVAAGASLVSVMVLDDEQVDAVVRELIDAAPAGTVVAIHSTIRPATAERLAHDAGPRGIAVLDAPVTGGPSGAREGTLAVMVGGEEAAVERCREPFACFSERLVHFGAVGSATRAKIARNLITFAGYVAAGEAQRLAEAAGADLALLGEVVRYSDTVTGGPGTIMLRDTAAPLAPDDPWYEVMSHTRDLGEKDLTLALELADSFDVDLPYTRAARELLAGALGVPHETSAVRDELTVPDEEDS